jgi:hypothetical protein
MLVKKIYIPDEYVDAIEGIRTLSESRFNDLCKLLMSLPKGIGHKLFVKSILENFDSEDIELLAEAIFSMGSLLVNDDAELPEIASDLTKSFLENREDEFTKREIRGLEERLTILLLNSESLKLTFEAYNTISNSQNVVMRTSINPEVRMVFDKDSIGSSKHAVITFNLKLTIKEKNGMNSEVFTLDEEDIVKLKSQLESVLTFQESIKSKHKDTNFIDLGQ